MSHRRSSDSSQTLSDRSSGHLVIGQKRERGEHLAPRQCVASPRLASASPRLAYASLINVTFAYRLSDRYTEPAFDDPSQITEGILRNSLFCADIDIIVGDSDLSAN